MTATPLEFGWRVTCNTCGYAVSDKSGLDEPLVRLLLADEGWQNDDEIDTCPKCVIAAATRESEIKEAHIIRAVRGGLRRWLELTRSYSPYASLVSDALEYYASRGETVAAAKREGAKDLLRELLPGLEACAATGCTNCITTRDEVAYRLAELDTPDKGEGETK